MVHGCETFFLLAIFQQGKLRDPRKIDFLLVNQVELPSHRQPDVRQGIGDDLGFVGDENDGVAVFALHGGDQPVEHILFKKFDDGGLQVSILDFDPGHAFGAVGFGNFRQVVEGFPRQGLGAVFDIDVPFGPLTKSSSDVIPFSIFACWNLLRESGFSEGAFNRIVSTAMNRLAPGETGLRPLDADTLTGFMNFWNSVRGIAVEPQITISPKGNTQVEWVKDRENFMVMEFQPNYDVFISLWKDDQPMEGIRSRETLPELIRVFDAMDENPLRWSNAA